jgi:hypothetical protein
MADQEEVIRAKEAHTEALLARPNVVGVGVGYKVRREERTEILSVVALVKQKVPRAQLAASALVPRTVEGIPTDVIEVGELRPLQPRLGRWRPAPGGVSLGHFAVTAGTLGCVVRDRESGLRLVLSNNHVLANCNAAQPGDAILQPGTADGGKEPEAVLARLERFERIQFEGEGRRGQDGAARRGQQGQGTMAGRLSANLVDAAVARPVEEGIVEDEILEVGRIDRAVEASLGMAVRKSGRTTGLTTGQVTVLDTTVTVDYGDAGGARFEGQIVTEAMSRPGDSGSLLVAGEASAAVGLLFAGSDQATLHNPIQAVLDCLRVSLG